MLSDYGALAQLASALPWHGRGHRFESDMLHQEETTRGALAQLVEQRPEEPCVPSSSLGGATIDIFTGHQ